MRVQTIVIILVLGGCAHRPPLTPATTPPAPAQSQESGSVAYKFMVEPGGSVTGRSSQELVSPRPTTELPLPNYPPNALAAHAGEAHVVVRILIDTTGRISNVTDSPVASSSPGPFAGEFRDAVLRALRHWRFTPGYFGKQDDDLGVRPEIVPVRYDVRFDFEIVGGEGRVRR
jgi:TonB family protein